MVLTAPGGKIPKDLSWNAGKKAMGNVDAFLKSLQNFDKDNVPENCVAAVERVRTHCPQRLEAAPRCFGLYRGFVGDHGAERHAFHSRGTTQCTRRLSLCRVALSNLCAGKTPRLLLAS